MGGGRRNAFLSALLMYYYGCDCIQLLSIVSNILALLSITSFSSTTYNTVTFHTILTQIIIIYVVVQLFETSNKRPFKNCQTSPFNPTWIRHNDHLEASPRANTDKSQTQTISRAEATSNMKHET